MWKVPPIIKVYEALGAVIDERLDIKGNSGKCFSSSGNKYYEIEYSPDKKSIAVNDNGSYWNGYLGYPAVAFLLQKRVLEYKADLAEYFKEIQWKDINQKFNNNFDKTITFIFKNIEIDKRIEIEVYAHIILKQIEDMRLSKLGDQKKPPSGY